MLLDLHKFARQLVFGWKIYLGLDVGSPRVYCLQVDREGNVVSEECPLPTLCFFYDTFCYFQLGIEFPDATPIGWSHKSEILIGLKKMGDEYIIKLPDSEFAVKPDTLEKAFYELQFEDIRTNLKMPWTDGKKRQFGFHVPKNAD